MILLHLAREDRSVMLESALISGVVTRDDGKTSVWLSGDNTPFTVKESIYDVARLRAAWALRFNAPALAGKLPIAIRMDYASGRLGEAPVATGIRFICCEHTERLRKERLAGKANRAKYEVWDTPRKFCGHKNASGFRAPLGWEGDGWGGLQ